MCVVSEMFTKLQTIPPFISFSMQAGLVQIIPVFEKDGGSVSTEQGV